MNVFARAAGVKTAGRRTGTITASVLALLLVSPLLSGCAIFHKKKQIACPHIGILGDADKITSFRPGGKDITDIDYHAEVSSISGTCSSADDGTAIDMSLSLKLIAHRGPALKGAKIGVPYFVAVVDRRDHQILAKATFVSPIKFAAGHGAAGVVEQVNEHIPLTNGGQGPNYEILAGFQLSAAELAYNRGHPGQ